MPRIKLDGFRMAARIDSGKMVYLRGAVPLMLMDQTVSVEAVRRTVAGMLRRQLSPEEVP